MAIDGVDTDAACGGERSYPGRLNHEGLGIEADFSLPAEHGIRSLNQIIEWRGKPMAIRVDNGPNTSAAT